MINLEPATKALEENILFPFRTSGKSVISDYNSELWLFFLRISEEFS